MDMVERCKKERVDFRAFKFFAVVARLPCVLESHHDQFNSDGNAMGREEKTMETQGRKNNTQRQQRRRRCMRAGDL